LKYIFQNLLFVQCCRILNDYLSESDVINQIERKINKHQENQSLDLLPMRMHMLAKSDSMANVFYP
jgi:hypothetical protein